MVHLTRGTVRMICLDLDGTLFTPRKEISGRSRKAIKGCLNLGMEKANTCSMSPCIGNVSMI